MLLCTFNALLNAYCSLHEKPIKIKCVDFDHQKIETIILRKIEFKLNFLNSHEKICISHGAYSFDNIPLYLIIFTCNSMNIRSVDSGITFFKKAQIRLMSYSFL